MSPPSLDLLVTLALATVALLSLESIGTLRFWSTLFDVGPTIYRTTLRIPALVAAQLSPQDGETPGTVLRIIDGQTALFHSRPWFGAPWRGTATLTGGEVMIEVRACLGNAVLLATLICLWLYLNPSDGLFAILMGIVGLVGLFVNGRERAEVLSLEVTKFLTTRGGLPN